MSDHIVQWRRLDHWPITKRMDHRDDCLRRDPSVRCCSCKPARLRANRNFEIQSLIIRLSGLPLGVATGLLISHLVGVI